MSYCVIILNRLVQHISSHFCLYQGIQCYDIPSVSNGFVSGCPISALYGDPCYFRCNDGFRTSEGLKSITKVCQDDGTFDGQDFQCDGNEFFFKQCLILICLFYLLLLGYAWT